MKLTRKLSGERPDWLDAPWPKNPFDVIVQVLEPNGDEEFGPCGVLHDYPPALERLHETDLEMLGFDEIPKEPGFYRVSVSYSYYEGRWAGPDYIDPDQEFVTGDWVLVPESEAHL